MKITTCILASFLLFSTGYSQSIEYIPLDTVFLKKVQISGITGDEKYLYLVAEECQTIYLLDRHTYKLVDSIDLGAYPSLSANSELEGLSIFGHFLLISDEGEPGILSYDLLHDTLSRLDLDSLDVSGFMGEYGLEGVGVDPSSNRLYIIREKNKRHTSELYTFNILACEESISLEYIDNGIISNTSSSWRYPGLCIDTYNSQILLLKSYYDSKAKKGKYLVEGIPLDSIYYSLSQAESAKLQLLDITKSVHYIGQGISSNLEGIYYSHKELFIVSDNYHGSKGCGQQSSSGTALIKVTFD